MADQRDLHVKVDGGEIIVTALGTSHRIVYQLVPTVVGVLGSTAAELLVQAICVKTR